MVPPCHVMQRRRIVRRLAGKPARLTSLFFLTVSAQSSFDTTEAFPLPLLQNQRRFLQRQELMHRR